MFEWENEEAGSEYVEPASSNLTSALTEVMQSNNHQEDFEDVMSEAERRFEVAQYYKLLLQDSLFQNVNRASQQVEAEIREFIRERLSVLLGIKQQSSTSEFSSEQIDVLKQFADLGENGPEVLKAVMGKLYKKIDKHQKTEQKPSLKTVKNEPGPALKKRQQAQPQKQNQVNSPKQNQEPVNSNIEIPELYKNDPTLKISANKVFVQQKNGQGELLWEKKNGKLVPLYRDVTPAAKPSGDIQPIPMPSGQQLSLITQQKAQASAQNQDSLSNAILSRM